jgi:hypothetical protein
MHQSFDLQNLCRKLFIWNELVIFGPKPSSSRVRKSFEKPNNSQDNLRYAIAFQQSSTV